MRIQVVFNNTPILVPCGDGKLTVGELIQKAIVRFKKLGNKVRWSGWVVGESYWETGSAYRYAKTFQLGIEQLYGCPLTIINKYMHVCCCFQRSYEA